MKLVKNLAVATAGVALFSSMAMAGTLQDVKKKGEVRCGVSTGIPGFSATDSKGRWKGADVDICRAVAAAVLGNDSKVKYVPLTAKERFTALQSGEIDLLVRTSTWTATRDNSLGLNFTGVNYYDGQGFLVKKDLGVDSAKELDGAAFCIQSGTTSELNLADYFKANGMSYKAVTYDTSDQTIQGFKNDRCDALTSDASQLYSLRTKLKRPSSAKVLQEIISKEPLGPSVRQGDDEWFNVVRWTLFAMLNAEELGITSKNVSRMTKSKNPDIQRLLGKTGQYGKQLGLSEKWAYNIIKQVGNYGESFEANLGKKTPLGIARGLNNLWTKGGIMYAPPVR